MDFAIQHLGKKVFSKSGSYVGKVKDIVFDAGALKGYLVGADLFIDKQFFTQDFEQALMLNMEPVTMIVGKLVFDSNGRKIGKVIDLERSTNDNDYAALLVKKNIISKPIVIPKKDVDITEDNVLLHVELK